MGLLQGLSSFPAKKTRMAIPRAEALLRIKSRCEGIRFPARSLTQQTAVTIRAHAWQTLARRARCSKECDCLVFLAGEQLGIGQRGCIDYLFGTLIVPGDFSGDPWIGAMLDQKLDHGQAKIVKLRDGMKQ